ncbi:MAG TPA: hypothetical protein PKC14_00475 [Candidatus Absconditabacterales bacterium]|nr:hypothetical protein [Candidatus Absconditabacterales bacterium]
MANIAVNKGEFKEHLSHIVSNYAKITDNAKSSIIDAFSTEKNSAIDYIQDRIDDLEEDNPVPPRNPNDLSNPVTLQIKNLSTIIENMRTPGKISPTATPKTEIEQTPEGKNLFKNIGKSIIEQAKAQSNGGAGIKKISAETITEMNDEDTKVIIETIINDPKEGLLALKKMYDSFPSNDIKEWILNLCNIITELAKDKNGNSRNGINLTTMVDFSDRFIAVPTTPSVTAPVVSPVSSGNPAPSSTREISATFSEIKEINEQQAQFEAEKELAQKYSRIKGRSLEKIGIFFMRGKIIDQEKKKILAKKSMTDKESALVANRHHEEFQENLALFSEENTFKDSAVESLCNDFIHETGIFSNEAAPEEIFKNQISKIAKDPTSKLYHELPANFEKTYGSNLLETIKIEKAHLKLIENINQKVKNFHTLTTPSETIINNFNQEIQKEIQKFTSTYKQLPGFLSELKLNFNDAKLLDKVIAHKSALEKIQAQNITVKLRTLGGGKGSLTNSNSEKEKIFGSKNLYDIMKKIDSYPRYIQAGMYAGMGGLATGTAMISGSAGVGLGLGSAIIGVRNSLKKQLHYTKEHNFSEQELLRDFSKQKRKMETLSKKVENYKFLEKYTSRKKRRETREVEAYQKTISLGDFISIESLNKEIEGKIKNLDFTDSNKLAIELPDLLSSAIQGLVRIDFKKEKNQTLLANNFSQESEKNYNDLLQNIKIISKISNISIDDIRNKNEYQNIKNTLENNYNEAFKNFKKEKINKGIKYGIGSTALYGVSGYLSKHIIDSLSDGLHAFQQRRGDTDTPSETIQSLPKIPVQTNGGVKEYMANDIDQALKENLQKTLGDKYQKFTDNITKSNGSTTLWSTLTKDIFENQKIVNEAKNEIMAYILNATEDGKSELITIALDHGMPLDENSVKFQATIKYLIGKNILVAEDSHSVAQALIKLKDSTNIQETISTMSPELKKKVSEFAFCSIGRNGNHGNNFFELFIDKVKETSQEITPENIIPGKQIPNNYEPPKTYKNGDTNLLIGFDATPNTFRKR